MAAGATPESSIGDKKILSPPGVPIEGVNYSSAREPFEKLHGFLATHPGLDTNSVGLLTYFIFASLFPECSDAWPFGLIICADGASSTPLLRTLGWILPESLRLSEITLGRILSLPDSPSQVLLIDQPMWSKELL